jgi:hypothetical protein
VAKGKQRFREAELARLIRVTQNNNLSVSGVRIDPDGAIYVETSAPANRPTSGDQNEWDAA